MDAKASRGAAVFFPLKVAYDSETDPGVEWVEDAKGRHITPYELVQMLNTVAPFFDRPRQ